MTNTNKGFTLTEILLAVMIVGLIGIALASLTTAASRESGVGRSKVMMRNNLSLALRTLRSDINNATGIEYAIGPFSGAPSGLSSGVEVLKLRKNVTADGSAAVSGSPKEYVTYCFKPGTVTTNVDGVAVVPAGSSIGGKLYRISNASSYPTCSAGGKLLLDNVKYIPDSAGSSYSVPMFCNGLACAHNSSNPKSDSLLSIRIITELNSSPVTNDAIEEIFVVPNGF